MPYELEFEDTFEGEALDLDRWLPYYLPHWSSRERSAARYEIAGGFLRLLIDADQQPWCPEFDGQTRSVYPRRATDDSARMAKSYPVQSRSAIVRREEIRWDGSS